MNENDKPAGRLALVGYEKLTDHGLALPIFGRSPGANMYYTARSSAPGEAGGCITGFDHYDPDSLILLPFGQVRETGVGEPWLDIFLWEGVPHVGTASEIWNSLADVRETIAGQAPLSLLALAEGVERVPNLQLVHKAFSWLTRRYGTGKASEWRNDTYLRRILLKGVRRRLGTSVHKAEIRRALRERLAIYQDGNKIIASIGSPLPVLPLADRQAFFSVATSFGLQPEYTDATPQERPARDPPVPRRTSESAMRIATLQVAASKPGGKATMTELKNEIDQYVVLTPEDLQRSKTRPNEAMYQQIVGNIVSHRSSKNNIFAKGWAIYTGDGIQITDAGRQYLRMLGL